MPSAAYRSGRPDPFPITSTPESELEAPGREFGVLESAGCPCVVALGRLLPDLPPFLHGRPPPHRRPGRHPGAPRPPDVVGRRRPVDLAVLPVPPGRLRLRRQRLLRRRPHLRRPGRLRPPAGRRPRAGLRLLVDLIPNHSSDHHPWFQAARSSGRPQRDWYIWRDGSPDGHAAQQLAGRFHPPAGLDLGRGHQPVVPAPVPAGPARPELGQPRGGRGHARRHALLARPGRGRVPHRRGHGMARPGPAGRPARHHAPPRHPQRHRREPRDPAGHAPAGRRLPGRPADPRRGLPARHPQGRHLLRLRRRAAPELQLPAALHPVGRPALADRIEDTERWIEAGAAGRPGCCPTTTSPATAPATAPRAAPGPRCSCCSGCGARRCSARARSWASRTPTILPTVVDPGGRDGCRAPIPWTGEPDHGWGVTDPWLPWPPEAGAERGRPGGRSEAIAHLYRRLLAARRASPALQLGDQEPLPAPPDVVAWRRSSGEEAWVVAVNMGTEPATLDVSGRVVVSSDGRARAAVRRHPGRRRAGALAPD